MHETLSLTTDERLETVDVTDRVEAAVPDALEAGTCTVFSRHTTAAVLLNENEPRLRDDLESLLGGHVPEAGPRTTSSSAMPSDLLRSPDEVGFT